MYTGRRCSASGPKRRSFVPALRSYRGCVTQSCGRGCCCRGQSRGRARRCCRYVEAAVCVSHFYLKRTFYQDRLGTNIGKALKNKCRSSSNIGKARQAKGCDLARYAGGCGGGGSWRAERSGAFLHSNRCCFPMMIDAFVC